MIFTCAMLVKTLIYRIITKREIRCKHVSYTFVTHNTKHFQGIKDLSIEDWAE